MKPLLQLKISLNGAKPAVWRRVLVNPTITFWEFHSIIQAVMGWTDSHLFEFNVGGKVIGDGDDDDMFAEGMRFAEQETLETWLKPTTKSFKYIYDFGDDWVHTITVEGMVTPEHPTIAPVCVAGAGACPPEDCGGVLGYQELINILKNPKHPDHEDMMEWIGMPIDPTLFDLDEANIALEYRNEI